MLKFLHTGDIHLDSPFASLSSKEAAERRQGLREVFSKIVDIANKEKVDALILAGDVFDAYPIRPETADSFLRDLSRAKMPVVISPGNHDPYTASSPYRTLSFPENVHIFTSETLTPFEIPEKKLRIYGAAYTNESFDARILTGFSVIEDDYTNIISLHSNLYGEGYSPISAEEISSTNADYIALAHIHKPTELLSSGKTHYAYCGCPESRDFGESYDTGICIVEIADGKTTLRRISVSDITYREAVVNLQKDPEIAKALPKPSGRELLRLTLVGEAEAPDLDAIEASLKGNYYKITIIDRTTEPRNIWEGIDDDGLRGVFLRKLKAELDICTTSEEKEEILLAAKLGIDAIENREL